MISALKNISAFKTAHSLSDADWLDIADVNRDGQVNSADLSFLNNLLTGNHLYLAGDFNMDGKSYGGRPASHVAGLQKHVRF